MLSIVKKQQTRAHNFKDHFGQRFGWLVAIEYLGNRVGDNLAIWRCCCDCGREVDVPAKQLRRGQTQSCGCFCITQTKTANTTHGLRKSRIYRIWSGMWNRCRNPNCKDFERYGGRGINICERWRSFALFLADMGQPPTPRHSIDRVNNDGDYEPGNCRWATAKQQANNRRQRKLIDDENDEENREDPAFQEWDDIGSPVG